MARDVIQHKDWASVKEKEIDRKKKKSEKEISETGDRARRRFINNSDPGSSVQQLSQSFPEGKTLVSVAGSRTIKRSQGLNEHFNNQAGI